MLTIEEAIQAVESAPPVGTFSATRYPYTYAADYLRTHWQIVPEEITEQIADDEARAMALMASRGVASKARQMWAEALGIADEDAARLLADAYLAEHGITKPPD